MSCESRLFFSQDSTSKNVSSNKICFFLEWIYRIYSSNGKASKGDSWSMRAWVYSYEKYSLHTPEVFINNHEMHNYLVGYLRRDRVSYGMHA